MRPHCLDTSACKSKSDKHCRSCNLKSQWLDPAFRATRAKSNARTLAVLREDPEFRAREVARALHAGTFANHPDSGRNSPASIAKRTRTFVENRMGWCPQEYRPGYFSLLKKKFTATEARRITEDLIRHEAKQRLDRRFAAMETPAPTEQRRIFARVDASEYAR